LITTLVLLSGTDPQLRLPGTSQDVFTAPVRVLLNFRVVNFPATPFTRQR
jgi:hypothetical protein